MMGANHAAMGGATWILLTTSAPTAMHVATMGPTGVIAGALVAAGSALLADADHHNGTIAHSAPGGKLVTGAVGKLTGGHRHGTHSLLGMAAAVIGSLALGGWSFQVGDSSIPIGIGIATMIIVGFGVKAMKVFQSAKVLPFFVGLIVALMVMLMAPADWHWFPWAVGIGYGIHLLGDFLTTDGLALLWPWVPKPPKWWTKSKFLSHFWKKNGYMAFPILGNAGGGVEYILGAIFAIYLSYGLFHETTILGTEALNNFFVWWETTWSAVAVWWEGLWAWLPF